MAKDDGLAVKWYRLAANQGDAFARNSLGAMYTYGRGVAKDDGLAVNWFRMAADQGNAAAQFNVGIAYANGQGVEKDVGLAYMWFNPAAAQGSANAEKNRDRVASTMTPTQIAEAQRLSREWKAK